MAHHKRAKRETCQRQRALGRQLLHHGQKIRPLAGACIVCTRRLADTAKVKAQRVPTTAHKGARQGLHHFVVHGAREERVRMGDDGGAAHDTIGSRRLVSRHFQNTGGPVDRESFSLRVHGATNLIAIKARQSRASGHFYPYPARGIAGLTGASAWHKTSWAPRGMGDQRPTSGGVSRRSTTWPFLRCDSMISSMSSLSI